jgi:hypothetical protein
MKKIILTTFLASMTVLFSMAQSSFKIMDPTGLDVTGTTVNVYDTINASYSGNFNIKNTSSVGVQTKLRKEEISNVAAGQSSICFAGTCYGSGLYVSPCKTDSAGKSVLMTADFTFGPLYSNPSATIRYTVYNCNNVNDSATFVIVYNPSPTGINNYALHFNISEPYPNPAGSVLNLDYKVSNKVVSSSIEVYNLLGNHVKTVDLTEANGTVKMDVSDMESGMYFYTLQLNGKGVATKRFIVRH